MSRPAAAPPAAPRSAEAAAREGLLALRSGREAEALPVLEAARAASPRDARLWQVTGLLHRALDDLEPAVAAFARAAALAPADPLIAHGHARAALEAGLPAVALFERAARLAPLDGPLLLGLAAALLAERGPGPALDLLDDQLRRNPGWYPGHEAATKLRWLAGDRDRFTASIDRALEGAPRDLGLWRELISPLVHAGLWDRALAAIARGRAAIGDHPVFDANQAVCLDELGRPGEAELFFARVGEGDATVAIRRVRHFLRRGRPEEAAALAEPLAATPQADLAWPYLAAAWRLLDDPRRHWLEGPEALVGIYDLAGRLPPLDRLADTLRALHVTVAQPLEQSVRGGTQTDGPLFSRIEPDLRALRAAIADAVAGHVSRLPPRDPRHPQLRHRRDSRIRFSGSWSVRLAGAGHHAAHTHPMGWFSSALYVALPDEAGRGEPPAGWLALGEPDPSLGLGLGPVRTIEPKPGRLVLFPSTMWHATRPFAEGERLTVAFDVHPPLGEA